jgi:hypothetical protein
LPPKILYIFGKGETMKSKSEQARIERLKKISDDYLKERFSDGYNFICQLCGFKHSTRRPFDFHHVNPENKKYKISKMAKESISMETIKREIDKCIFICSNCHRIIHETVIVGNKKKVIEESDQLSLF